MMWIISYHMWILLLLLPVHCFGGKLNLTIVDDIWNAFRAVTNDSALLDHIIPEMYGQTMRNANPTFVFKMPRSQRNGFELLKMQRSDFAEPIFPNITKLPKITMTALQTPLDSNKGHVKSTIAAGEWEQLGLDGWSGELTDPEPWLEENHKDAHHEVLQASYPREEILLDLKGQNVDGKIKEIRVISSNRPNNQRKDQMSARHVYLARANNPFGYSMKWALSNETRSNLLVRREPNDRGKRDVAKLYSMIKCSTGCDPLIYKGYGCYCGFGGHGVAVDGIDRCCRLHDKCYEQSNCISYLEYFVPYVWKCYRGKPLCAVDHGEWGGPDSCAARLCQCDLRLSRCLRNFYCPNRRSVCHSSRTRRLQNLLFFD